MKIRIWIALAAALALASSSAVAEEGYGERRRAASQTAMARQGGMPPSPVMVASGDGGVIVMRGKRLMKFDKDLNFVKEVVLPEKQQQGGWGAEGSHAEPTTIPQE